MMHPAAANQYTLCLCQMDNTIVPQFLVKGEKKKCIFIYICFAFCGFVRVVASSHIVIAIQAYAEHKIL